MKYKTKQDYRWRRHRRIRKKIAGTGGRPRLCVAFSNRHIHAQLIDDDQGITLCAVSTATQSDTVANTATAAALGAELAVAAKELNIDHVVVDRAGFRYHGRLKALVEAALEGGLKLCEKEEA